MTRRAAKDLLGVPRSLGRSHGLTQRDLYRERLVAATGTLDKAGKFLKTRVLDWLWHYLKTRLGGRHGFASYLPRGSDRGVYPLQGDGQPRVKVSVAGDWGTGSDEAAAIAGLMARGRPDVTIHLGDVYYVGTKKEVLENMLGGQVNWPRGSRRSFALNGNHEMYARGKAYFDQLLPALGQRASYFALRNDHWLLIGLDTGYNSVGIPILEKILTPSCKLRNEILAWLRDDLALSQDNTRGIILFSHHQYYSAFEGGYEQAARQLESLIRRPVLWLWGHEHRFAVYGKSRGRKSQLEVYGRCVGHGAMPVEDLDKEPDEARARELRLALYDRRQRLTIPEADDKPIGYNGYADLVFQGPELTMEHRDIKDQLLVREQWRVGPGGVLQGMAIERHVADPGLVSYADLRGAIA